MASSAPLPSSEVPSSVPIWTGSAAVTQQVEIVQKSILKSVIGPSAADKAAIQQQPAADVKAVASVMPVSTILKPNPPKEVQF